MTTWNPSDKSANITLSETNHRAANVTSGGNIGVRANFTANTGKFYYEAFIHSNDQNYYNGCGVAKTSANLNSVYAGTDGVTVAKFGAIVVNGSNIVSGYADTQGQWNRYAVDLDAKKFWHAIGSGDWNNDPSADPATGTNGIDVSGSGSLNGQVCAPVMASVSSDPAAMDATANFGDSAYAFTPPAGFGNWAADEEAASSDAALSDQHDSDERASSDYLHDVTWNPADKTSTVTLTNSNLTAQTNGVAASAGTRATLAHKSGKKYFEVHIDEINGGNQFQLFGIGPNDIDLATDFGAVYNGTKPGGAFIQMGFHDGGGHFQMQDITIAFAVDFKTRQCRFKVRIGNAGYTGDWSTGSPFAKGFQFPTLLLTDSGIGDILKPTITANFGAQAFQFEIPAGFAAWDGQQGADSGAESIFKGTVAISGGNIADTNQTIAYSRDGNTFTLGTNPTHTNGSPMDYNLAAGTNIFVGVSKSASDNARAAIYSLDGITWSPATAAENNTWNGVCYAPEIPLFVAVAEDGTNRVMISPDGLPGNWSAVAMPGSARSWRSVCWSPELHLFCAVANNGGGLTDTIATSPDGTNWTLQTSPFDRTWENVIWVPIYGEIPSSGSASIPTGLFIATPLGATGGDPDYATSPDGVHWTARTTGKGTAGFYMSAYSPDLGRTVSVSSDFVCYTDDGFTWTGKITIPGSPSLQGVGWSRVGQCFIALASSGQIYSSEDGDDWIELDEPASRFWHSFAELLDHTETPSSALESFLDEHPSSSFDGEASSSAEAPGASSSAGGGASSEPASSAEGGGESSTPETPSELPSSTLEQLSSEHQSDLKDEIPPPIQVVVTLAS